MKKVLFLSLIFMLSVQLQAQKSNYAQYAIKSGYVKYKITGNTQGIKELWWDDFGAKRKELEQSSSTVVIFGIKSEEKKHTLAIYDENKYYEVNYAKNTAQKFDIPFSSAMQGKTEKEREKEAERVINSLGGHKEGEQSFLGYKCTVYRLLGAKTWVYKGIPLKTNANILGIESNVEAVEFKKLSSLPKNTFTPPSDVKFEEQDVRAADLGALFQKAYAEENNQNINDNEEQITDIKPTKYPYDKFQKIVNNFQLENYTRILLISMQGVHAANFVKGFEGTLSIVATSKDNPEYEKNKEQLTKKKHKGKTYYFIQEKENSIIILDVPQYDSYIVISTEPVMPEDKMLKILDRLPF